MHVFFSIVLSESVHVLISGLSNRINYHVHVAMPICSTLVLEYFTQIFRV